MCRNEPMNLRRAGPHDLPLLRHWDTKPHVIAARGADGAFNWETELLRNVPWREMLVAELGGRPLGMIQIIDPVEEEFASPG